MIRSLLTVVTSGLLASPLVGQEPEGRIYHSMVSRGADILVFGGVTEHGWTMDLLDVWSLDPLEMQWSRLGSLTPGDSYSAAYDSQSERVIVFSLAGETWAFEPSNGEWDMRTPSNAPSGRCGQRTVYDPTTDRVLLFGGFGCTAVSDPVFSDLWAYDYEADQWEELTPDRSPPARMYHAMEFDPSMERVVVWGGRVEDEAVWSYESSTNEWTRHEIAEGPTGIRSYHTMTYEPTLDGLLIFGGLELDAPLSFEGSLTSETLLLNLEDGEWRRLRPGASPSPRSHHAAVVSQLNGRVLIYGGELETSYSGIMTGEVWSFDPVGLTWVLERR